MNATLARLSRLTCDSLPIGDGPLLDAFLAGDQAAFAALVHRHAGLVFATCRRVLQHQQDTEDAFQATFLVLARRAADVWPREAVSSWLFGVAHRVALKARAARGRRAGREQQLEVEPGTEPPAHDFDLAEAVHRVVLKLPAAYRAAVVACDLEGLSRKDAAERLGWSEGTLSGRLARARALLADRLRGAGLSLPAAGIAVLETNEHATARAVQNTIDVAIGTAGAAPAPVAVLAEGVVRSMTLFKLKAVTAAVFVTCALGFGFGALASTGAGEGSGTAADPLVSQPSRPKPVAPDAPLARPAPKGPRVDLARQELEVLLQEIEYAAIAGKVDKEAVDKLRGRLQAADRLLIQDDPTREPKPPLTDRDRLQGVWRVTTITEGGTTKPTNPKDPWIIEVVSRTIRLPFREAEGQWKQREYLFSVSPREQRSDSIEHPATIDLTAPNRPLGKGIYEFTAPVETCVACHTASKGPKVQFGFVRDRIATVGCAPGLESEGLGVRLALSISGKRPAKFEGDGVLVFELRRAPKEEQKVDERAELIKAIEAAQRRADEQAELIEAKKKLEAALQAAIAADDKAKLEAELAVLKKRVDELLTRKGRRETETEFRRAELEYQKARAQLQASQAELDQATAKFQVASGKLAAAKKAFDDANRPVPGPNDEVYTIHVRSLTAPEQVIRVKITGSEAVLDCLELIPGPPIKPEAVSAWVVRGGKILPVDLVAITKRGTTSTNYQLKAGDQLFIQAKPSK